MEGAVTMELPEGFTDMGERRREEFFPLEGRPEIILEHEREDVQVTLQILNRMKTEEVEAAIGQVRRTVEENFVQYQCSPVYLETDREIRTGWFLMQMKDIGKEHIKAVFSFKGNMALLTLTYPEGVCTKWHAVWGMILESMKGEKEDGVRVKWKF